ncbi:MAG: response regulator [Isosphaeraceae bacterium]
MSSPIPGPKPPRANADGRRVLLVEDNDDAAKSMARLLHFKGFVVEIAPDADSALEALDRTRPDIVITDLSLPDRDGRAVSRHARTLVPRPNCVMITGWPLTTNPQEMAEWGIDRIFAKPVEFTLLYEYLERIKPGASGEGDG